LNIDANIPEVLGRKTALPRKAQLLQVVDAKRDPGTVIALLYGLFSALLAKLSVHP
jgi:hypothetical protein